LACLKASHTIQELLTCGTGSSSTSALQGRFVNKWLQQWLKSWQSHTGLNLAVAFAAVLQDFHIEHKILLVTYDNTSNNDTMVAELDEILPSFSPVNCTWYFTHILNLVSKSLLCQFDVKKR